MKKKLHIYKSLAGNEEVFWLFFHIWQAEGTLSLDLYTGFCLLWDYLFFLSPDIQNLFNIQQMQQSYKTIQSALEKSAAISRSYQCAGGRGPASSTMTVIHSPARNHSSPPNTWKWYWELGNEMLSWGNARVWLIQSFPPDWFFQ